MESLIITILIAVATFIAINWYKASKKEGKSAGEGATIQTPDEGKGKQGDQAY